MDSSLDFLSKIAEGVIGINREQRIIFWNAAAEKLTGFGTQEVLGRFCHEVICGRDESGHIVCQESCLKELLAGEQQAVSPRDIRILTKTGSEVWLSMSTVLAPSGRRDLSVLLHLFRDVTQQKELERSVQHLRTVLAKLPPKIDTTPEPDKTPCSDSPDLTNREKEILRLLASGCSTKEIANNLFISPATVRNHIHNLLTKLGVRNRLEAAILALRNRLI